MVLPTKGCRTKWEEADLKDIEAGSRWDQLIGDEGFRGIFVKSAKKLLLSVSREAPCAPHPSNVHTRICNMNPPLFSLRHPLKGSHLSLIRTSTSPPSLLLSPSSSSFDDHNPTPNPPLRRHSSLLDTPSI
ncbi:hypothetical protein FRC15_011620 [Serendipita sp. 397]|nr:hypothetical protein FRC15_011620 [Serendipita sp. 397]